MMQFKTYALSVTALAAAIPAAAAISFENGLAVVDDVTFKTTLPPAVGQYIVKGENDELYNVEGVTFEGKYAPLNDVDPVEFSNVEPPEPEIPEVGENYLISTHEQGGGDFELLLFDLKITVAGLFKEPIEIPKGDVEALAKMHADQIENAMRATGHDVRVTPIMNPMGVQHVVARENGYASILVEIYDEGDKVFFGANPAEAGA